ncbi:hypothetical protein PTTG_26919 [Puccinia triticina 1-1 BBBD Race 1]|uniref:DUF7143 domain-containing protein n=2 Tax=Puccinia triticina TaxID=208348 RepID=A0A180GQB7_PUCT1|nr:uncharacterized protein PtA15_12A315 [Puccinia triticina]OAV94741.1 hypothetical protein PTTG_26919 [Puccinia triticina 1-1 BBBD Race 1]WAQ90326.1 hypothetical protein PtA15_12A315 [Puccinia triticina]WAR61641.1 hypothetical protein PtB15_12B331 [Puccinia triticina]
MLFPLILILVFHSASIVKCQGTNLCYLTGGTVPLTKEVVPPTDVKCPGGKTVLGKVPDLLVDNTRFSQIDFTQSKSKPGRFALDKFTFSGEADRPALLTAGKLYTAANAALRVRGDKNTINKLKVVDFFIASQIEAAKGEAGNANQARLLDKVLKNCIGKSCSSKDRDDLTVMRKKLDKS